MVRQLLADFAEFPTGAGESGKSTVVKQLKVLHKVDIDQQEINNYKITLHNNTLTSMQTFLEAARKFGYPLQTDEEKALAEKVEKYCSDSELKMMTPEIGEAIVKLSQTEAVKRAFLRRNEFWNLDASD